MKNKIVYLIIILLCGYNVFVPSDSLQKQELKYVNEYIKLPLPDDSETLIPQGNKVPRYYSLYADKNFDLEEFLAILRRQGWVDHEKYRDNEEIMHIGGSYIQRKKRKDIYSYYFSAYAITWGFATWKSTWKYFNLNISEVSDEEADAVFAKYAIGIKEKLYWNRVFNILKKNQIAYWNYQYNFHIWRNNGLCVSPNVNLVKNIGIKSRRKGFRRLMRDTYQILPLKDPKIIERNRSEDKKFFKKSYNKAFFLMFFDWINNILGNEKKL